MAAKNIRKYRPKMPFDVTFGLWIPTTQVVRGVAGKDYVAQDGDIMHFRFNV